jgi:hypothetical protein
MFNNELNKFKHDFKNKKWALLYLHNWDPPTEANPYPIWPEIHGIYDDYETALENQNAMGDPSSYYIRGVYNITKEG